jgi:hypothetical protein
MDAVSAEVGRRMEPNKTTAKRERASSNSIYPLMYIEGGGGVCGYGLQG